MGEDAEALLTVGLILNRTVTPIGCYYYYRVPLACHTEYARSGDLHQVALTRVGSFVALPLHGQ